MENRVSGNKIDISYENTLEFFEHRGNGKELKHKYNYVLFQDENPELAILRDSQEKQKISNLLTWNKEEMLLDIGCGIGRWGEFILERGVRYIGIDYSKNLLNIAKKNLESYNNKKLIHGSFQEILSCLSKEEENTKFDKIFINGVMMYLNDSDLKKGLVDVAALCKESCEIYIKESMALDERLTLNQIYSESLTQNYTAIYRSISEYRRLIETIFGEDGFEIVNEGALFEETLKNRRETLDYYFVIRR
ncbi:Methyltransferase domain-containing protein [Anaerosporobacter mobilis DSM 15930]|uniref:Methyltransferase domain-containing protein n=1 Tax=Anaerosporobacter mobilis DSM 15930 TaxID=1120996 RepID=A0A1M7LNN9_9FIRM|nr:class I SAM-dependent methyltransferase [Anaerosporobacter mobilis]SHM79867.1 Methyltransferase domain-containing protein [Anaerosporobacter mobilis DSM 15930]